MKLKLPKATANGHRQIARALWRNAPNLPTAAERVRALEAGGASCRAGAGAGRKPGPRAQRQTLKWLVASSRLREMRVALFVCSGASAPNLHQDLNCSESG